MKTYLKILFISIALILPLKLSAETLVFKGKYLTVNGVNFVSNSTIVIDSQSMTANLKIYKYPKGLDNNNKIVFDIATLDLLFNSSYRHISGTDIFLCSDPKGYMLVIERENAGADIKSIIYITADGKYQVFKIWGFDEY